MRKISLRAALTVAAAATMALGTAGCADADSKPVETPSTGSALDKLQVGTRGELPACDAQTDSLLAYIVDE